ncbi:hypothetical protein ATG98_3506 [Marinobacter sp. LV10R520-4]|uniref:hypothetical protein n=1 Tax=Marinobacter sp. LV10R520-4 TaxID=1761796 RepID=UPI000BF771DC|nr:hypothetical protein [Marinobacter sp. LV10R520-4]PFG54286.1 hypothetical protein ATG98_3506 [Marinobacter sp. LV10R520-4]
MSVELRWHYLRCQVINLNDRRSDDFDSIIRYMMGIAESIVDEYKQDREFNKNNDSRFQFWTYVPSVERGASSVVIRWRRYNGSSRYSEPIATSLTVENKIPQSFFPGCKKSEKKAVLHAEKQFSIVRKINEKLLEISQAQNALMGITGARELKASFDENSKSGQKNGFDADLGGPLPPAKIFTETDRTRLRKSLGLDR